MDRFRLFPSGELGMHPTGEWTSYGDAQRALDAAQELSAAWAEKARQYELELEGDPQNLHGQGRTFGLRSQLATLQAQLAQPIRVCQGCGRVSRDGWVTARYECDELRGSLQCPDCQCIDLEINTAKELATLCTQAQAQLRQVEGAYQKLLNVIDDSHDEDLPIEIIEARDEAYKFLAAKDAGKEVGNGNS